MTALTKSVADIRAGSPAGPAKDVPGTKTLEIEFKTDSTISPKSEKMTWVATILEAGPSLVPQHRSSRTTSKSSQAQYKKNDARNSGDSTLISKAPAPGKGSGSARKQKPAVTSKTQNAQEIRYHKIANKNRLAENAKKKAAHARERER